MTSINPVYLGNRTKRFLAFCIDIFPITFIVITVYRQFYEYDAIIEPFLANPDDTELRDAVIMVQNKIGQISGAIYLIYCFLMEASVYQATYGKRLMRLKVISSDGGFVSPREAFWRNALKILSQAVFNIGFFWIFFDRQKRGWHDIIGKTLVVDRNFQPKIDEEVMENLQNISETDLIEPDNLSSEVEYKSLTEGNQSNLLYPADIDQTTFEQVKADYPDYFDRYLKYIKLLYYEVKSANAELPNDLFWNNSTYGQKLIQAFQVFDYEVKSDGIANFIFKKSELMHAMPEVFETIGADQLRIDYQTTLEELQTDTKTFENNIKIFNTPSVSANQKQTALLEIQSKISSPMAEDAYYVQSAASMNLYKKVCDYIESNPSMFV